MDDTEILDWMNSNILEVQYFTDESSGSCTVTYLDSKGSIRYASGSDIRTAVVTAVEQSE